jgi:hypothetical protein
MNADQWQDVLALDICHWSMWSQINPHWDIKVADAKARRAAKEAK